MWWSFSYLSGIVRDMKKIAEEEKSDSGNLSPFAKGKKTKSSKPPQKMRSTHVSTMPPAQNLFGRLIQTMNVANTQNVRDQNPGWDIYAAATRVTAAFDKSGALWSPGMPTADEFFKKLRFPRPLTEGERAAMDRYSRGTFTTPMPEFMRRHWESVNPFGLGNRERVPKLSGRPTDFNPLLMKMSEGKVEKVMGEYKRGKLRSGSKTGPKVKSKDQAIAIALSEAREAGEDVPEKKSEVRKMKVSEFCKIAAKVMEDKNLPKTDIKVSSAEEAYVQGMLEKLAEAGYTEKEAQGFLDSLGETLGARPGEGLLQMLGRRGMAIPRWIGRNPGKSALGAMAMPMFAPAMLGAGIMGKLFPKKQTMWERLRGGAGDLGSQLKGLF